MMSENDCSLFLFLYNGFLDGVDLASFEVVSLIYGKIGDVLVIKLNFADGAVLYRKIDPVDFHHFDTSRRRPVVVFLIGFLDDRAVAKLPRTVRRLRSIFPALNQNRLYVDPYDVPSEPHYALISDSVGGFLA